jgi:hypothetical protein
MIAAGPRWFRAARWFRRSFNCRRAVRDRGWARVFAGAAIEFEQGHQRIERRQRIKVEDDAMTVAAERLQREQLRIHVGLEIEHDAHYPGLEASNADRLDVRVVGLDLLR